MRTKGKIYKKMKDQEKEEMMKNKDVTINLHMCNYCLKINGCYLRLMGF